MKTDSTTDSTGVMMPKDANAMRVQTTLVNKAAKPRQEKKEKQNPPG